MPLLGPNSTILRVPGNATLYGKVIKRNGRLSRQVIQPHERIPKGFEIASISVPKEDKLDENTNVNTAKKGLSSKTAANVKAQHDDEEASSAVPSKNESATTVPRKRKRSSTPTASKAAPKPKPSSTKSSSTKRRSSGAKKPPLKEVSMNSQNKRPRTQTTMDSWLVKQPAA